MTSPTLDTVVTDRELHDLIGTTATLDERFQAVHQTIGSLSVDDVWYTLGVRKLRAVDHDGLLLEPLTIGELYALWCAAAIDAAEEEWSAAVDEALAKLNRGELADASDFCAAMAPADRRRARRRTAATKKAYGITYTDYMKRGS